MPISEFQKRQIVTMMGEDPSKFTTDDEGTMLQAFTPPKPQPSISPTPVPKGELLPSTDSPLMTVGKTFAQDAPSSIGAGLGAGEGLALGGSLMEGLPLALRTRGASLLLPLITTLLGGYAGGKVTKAAQDQIEPEEWQKNVALSQQQNPKSAMAGNLATLPLAGFNPSPTRFAKAGGALAKLATGAPMMEGEASNLLNVGAGAGIGAGQAMVQGDDLKSILLNAAIGGVFNKPNVIGKRLGFHDTQPYDINQDLQGGLIPRETTTGTEPIAPAQPRQPLQIEDRKQGIPMPEVTDSTKLEQQRQQKIVDFQKAKQELENQKIDEATKSIQDELQQRQAQITPQQVNPQKTSMKGVEAGSVEAGNVEVAQESPADLQARRVEEQLAGREQPKYSEETKLEPPKSPSDIYTKFEAEQVPTLKEYAATSDWYKKLADFGFKFRGVKMDASGNPIDVNTGKPVAGQAILRQAANQVGTIKLGKGAGADTPVHELLHHFFNDLLQSGRLGDRRLMEKYYGTIEKTPEYSQWKSARDAQQLSSTPEEYAATNGGYEFLRQHLNVLGETPLKKWFNDFRSHLKTRYTEHATPEDYQRLLNYRLMYDKPFSGEGIGPSIAGTRNQDESKIEPNIEKPVLGPNMDTARRISGMTPDEFKNEAGGFNKYNLELGKNATPADAQELVQLHKKANDEMSTAFKKASESRSDKDIGDAVKLASKPQFFNEAISEYEKKSGAKLERLSEQSKLLDPMHDSIPIALEGVENGIKHGTMDEEAAVEFKKNLVEQINWKDNEKLLKKIMATDFESEKQVASLRKEFSKLSPQPIEVPRQLPPDNLEANKPQPKESATKLRKVPQDVKAGQEPPKPIQPIDETKLVREPISAEEQKSRIEDTKSTWREIDSTRRPYETATSLRERYQKTYDYANELRDSGQMHSNEYEGTLNRMVNLQAAYEHLRDKFKLISAPDIGPKYSEESKLPEKSEHDKLKSQLDYLPYIQNRDIKSKIVNRVIANATEKKDSGLITPEEHQSLIYNSNKWLRSMRMKQHQVGEEPQNQIKSFLPSIARPEIEKIANIEHPKAQEVADSLTKFYEYWRQYKGKFTNDIVGKLVNHIDFFNPKELFFQDNQKMRNVVNYLWDMQDSGSSSIKLTPEEQKIRSYIQDTQNLLKDEKNAVAPNLPSIPFEEHFLPQIPARKVLDTLFNKSGTPEATKLWRDWNDYYTNTLGLSQAAADRAAKQFSDAYLKQETNLASQFRPIDKGEEFKMPRSWRDNSLVDIMSRYTTRYGRRLAYYKSIENDPVIKDALYNPKTGLAKNQNVRNVLENIQGVTENEEAKRTAASGVFRAGALGTLTGSKDFVSNLTLGFQHLTPRQALQSPFDAWMHMRDNIADSFKTGVNRQNIASLEFGDGGIDDLTTLLRRSRDILNVLQGRNWLEQMTRATAFGQGRFATLDNLASLRKSQQRGQGWTSHLLSKTQEKFMDDFAPKDWRTRAQTPEDIAETAAKYVESVQGKYDFRGLPSISQKGTLSPYLALSRWNIEKMNNFNQYVVQPALKGNITPLLMSTIGMVLGGAAVTKLVELTTGRKEKTPKYEEIMASKDKLKGLTYKLAGLASLSGYAGMLGDLTKSAMDIEFKNRPQSFNNPLIAGVESVAQNGSDILEAVQNGDLNITGDAISQMLEDTLQTYRLGLAHLSSEKQTDIEKSNKYRDLKLFKSLNDLPVPSASSERANPFLNKDIKDFKKTQDMGEATRLLPKLFTKAFEDSKGNVDVLRSKLNGIKLNNYDTLPNPDRIPYTFAQYLQYVSKTQGADKAAALLTDYYLKNAVNKAKSSMIPSI